MHAIAYSRGALDEQIGRFNRSFRKRVRRLAGLNPRLADVVLSFPAAAFALVSGYGTSEQRARAIQLIKDGAPLRAVADELYLPVWVRKLPPEAFFGPLDGLPAGAEFGRRIGGLVPDNARVAPFWLDKLMFAARACDDEFAVWVGAQRVFRNAGTPALPTSALFPLAAYAWYSTCQEDVPARELISRPWAKNLALGTAAKLARDWVDRITLDVTPQPKRRGPGRYSMRNGSAGYAFVALQTKTELYEEGRAMNHCVASYTGLVEGGQCLIFGIRIGQQRIATLELRRMRGARRQFGIVQLQGPSNRPVPKDVRNRVELWLARHADDPLAGATTPGTMVSVDAQRWKRIWEPYLAAKPGIGRAGAPLTQEALLTHAGQLAQLQARD